MIAKGANPWAHVFGHQQQDIRRWRFSCRYCCRKEKRYQGTNKNYGTRCLVTDATKQAAGEGFAYRLVDHVAVKGKTEPVDIYEPLGREGEAR